MHDVFNTLVGCMNSNGYVWDYHKFSTSESAGGWGAVRPPVTLNQKGHGGEP